jgi:hypothetical protein
MWDYDASGYAILRRYLRDRELAVANAASLEQLRRVAGALAHIVQQGPTLDELLARIVERPLRTLT